MLKLNELLFCLPLCNGHLGRIFSHMKFIKNNRQTNLSKNRLDQLMRINVDGRPVEEWDPSGALESWYKQKCISVTASTRAYTSHVTESGEEEKDEQGEPFSLDEWKEWLQIISGE